MRNKIYLLLGIFILLSLLPIVSAFDWTSYGNGFSPMWQEAYSSLYGELDDGITTQSIAHGYTPSLPHRVQPLVSNLNSSGDNYAHFLIFPNGNYLQIYDENLNLIDEIITGGQVVNQFDVMDFDGNALEDEVVGIYNISERYVFKVHYFNTTSQSWSEFVSYNLTGDFFGGIRNNGDYAVFVAGNRTTNVGTLTYINWSGSAITLTQHTISNVFNTLQYREPLAWADFDDDGEDEYLYWDDNEIMVFDTDGDVEFNYNFSTILDAKFYRSDTSGYWRIAILNGTGSHVYLRSWKHDGTSLWSRDFFVILNTYRSGSIAVVDDYDGNVADNELYVGITATQTGVGRQYWLYVLDGSDGTTEESYTSGTISGNYGNSNSLLTIADVNNNGYYDFIYSMGGINSANYYLSIYDPFTDTFLIDNQLYGEKTASCIPADLNFDGFLEVICSGQSATRVYSSTTSNQNAYIISVLYDPSIVVQVNTSLIAYVQATDPEGNTPLVYIHKCSNSASWSSPSTNNARSCTYTSLGTFNHSVGVRDAYHTTYDLYSQEIVVTQTGAVCNNNFICESGIGETYINCPNDCPVPEEEEIPDTTTATGGLTLPTKLVDTDNINQGLLPEIYYGTLGFFSSVLTPTIVLVFVIFFALIMITIGLIVKKFAKKVSDISR